MVDHPNIVRFYEIYKDPSKFHIVTEYCAGGELYSNITKKGKVDEAETAIVML